MEYNLDTKQLLESAGFADVKDYTVQVSTYVVQRLNSMLPIPHGRDIPRIPPVG